jgi:putative restriction endonuclease
MNLVASHTKPWRDSTNDERLDGENGLTLTIDHLFASRP